MNNLNDRIKNLRKDKGLTQQQLAEKLNVTDKAVSKWEVGESKPDLAIIVNMASLFQVSIDYLLTGKEKQISLDDMDATKRTLYIIEKDDVELLKKYTNIRCTLLAQTTWNNTFNKNNDVFLKAIYENKSYKIFNFLLDAFLINDRKINSNIISPATLIYDSHFEDFIKFCFLNERIDALEFIKFSYFAIKDKNGAVDTFRTFNRTKTYEISEELFDLAFDNNKVSQKVINYVGQVYFSNQRDDDMKRKHLFYSLNDYTLFELYKHKNFDLLNKALSSYLEFNKYLIEKCQSQRDSNGFRYEFRGYGYFRLNENLSSDIKLMEIAEPIVKALKCAINNLDVYRIKKFNEINRMLKKDLDINIDVIDDETIKQFEIKADKNISDDEKIVASFTKYGILNYKGLINSIISGIGYMYNKKFYETAIAKVIKFNKEYISKRPICFLEMIEQWVKDKNYNKLYKFAVDYNIKELEEAIFLNDDDKIMEVSSRLFGVPKTYLAKYKELKEKEEAIKKNLMHANTLDQNSTIKSLSLNSNYQLKCIQDKISKLTFNINSRYKDMLEFQYSFISYEDFINCDSFVKHFADIKETYINEQIKMIKDKIEKITRDDQFKSELEKINKEISFDYLRNQLSKGNIETVIIKLCVKIEAILKYSYRYTGDLFTMIDFYIKNNLIIKKTHDCWDDEDNNYYFYKEEDEKIRKENKITENKIEVLHKLRKLRNNIVHAEHNDSNMSIDEIELCIKIAEAM